MHIPYARISILLLSPASPHFLMYICPLKSIFIKRDLQHHKIHNLAGSRGPIGYANRKIQRAGSFLQYGEGRSRQYLLHVSPVLISRASQ